MTIPLWLTLPLGGGTALAVVAVAATMGIGTLGNAGWRQAPLAAESRPAALDPAAGTQGERSTRLNKRFDAARAEHDQGNHAQAFADLAALADEGHCEAARLALQLIHAGPEAYLMSFRAGPKQISRWRNLPGCWPSAPVR